MPHTVDRSATGRALGCALDRALTRGTALATACTLLASLAACELLKKNEDVLATLNQRIVGMPSGTFFDRYGRATSRSENADGGVRYLWASQVGFATPGPNGLDDRVCRLVLTADKQGRMSTVDIQFDPPGLTSTSRCREIFLPA